MTIVCATDLGPSGARAADVAIAVASALGRGIELVHAATGTHEAEPGLDSGVRPAAAALSARLRERHDAAVAALEAERARLVLAGGRVLSARVVEGHPAEVVVGEATSLSAELAVVGPHARTVPVLERFLGSTADHVVRNAPCPVLVACGTSPVEPLRGRVALVGVDGTPGSAAVLRALLPLATTAGLDVKAVWVGAAGPASDAAFAAAREAARSAGTQLSCAQADGSPADALVEAARKERAVLVAVGTRAHPAPVRAVLGSVAQGVVRSSPVPVLLVRAR